MRNLILLTTGNRFHSNVGKKDFSKHVFDEKLISFNTGNRFHSNVGKKEFSKHVFDEKLNTTQFHYMNSKNHTITSNYKDSLKLKSNVRNKSRNAGLALGKNNNISVHTQGNSIAGIIHNLNEKNKQANLYNKYVQEHLLSNYAMYGKPDQMQPYESASAGVKGKYIPMKGKIDDGKNYQVNLFDSTNTAADIPANDREPPTKLHTKFGDFLLSGKNVDTTHNQIHLYTGPPLNYVKLDSAIKNAYQKQINYPTMDKNNIHNLIGNSEQRRKSTDILAEQSTIHNVPNP